MFNLVFINFDVALKQVRLLFSFLKFLELIIYLQIVELERILIENFDDGVNFVIDLLIFNFINVLVHLLNRFSIIGSKS